MVHTAVTSTNIHRMKLVYKCAQQVRGSVEDFTNRDTPDTSIPISSSVDDISVELYPLFY